MTDVFTLLGDSLLMREESFEYVQTANGLQQCFFLFLTAAISKGLGEAGVLLINRVTKTQFVRSLVASTVILAFTGLIWSSCIWLACRYGLGMDLDLFRIQTLVLVSYTPLVFGFLIIVPHLGLAWHRLLMVWMLLITLAGLHYQFGLTLLQGIACSGGGWLVFYLLNYLFGGFAQKIKVRLLGRENWVKAKDAAVALLEKEIAE